MVRLPEPGAEWAGFRIEEEIGEGGFGRVYAAWDPVLERRVALKVLAPESPDDELAGAVRERFLRESRTAAGLDHPRIVPIHTASEYQGVPYLVMRFVDGGDLRGELRRGPLSLARTVTVISQVADALDRAHRSGLVHRDVKPANVLCAAEGDDVYLTDFGITRQMRQPAGQALTRTGQVPASPHYASPEQLVADGELGPATDVYSLGCTAFECLTGRVPFPGSNHLDVGHQHLHAPRPTVTRHRPDLPAPLDDVLARALAVEPEDRYPSCTDFAAALAAVRDGTASVPVSPAPVPTAPTDPTGVALGAAAPPPGPSRSVFDGGDTAVNWSPAAAGATETSERLEPTVSDAPPPPGGPSRRVVEVEWDDPDRDRPPSRTPWIVGGALALAVLGVAALVVWAVNTDADLDATSATTTTAPRASATGPPTIDELRALVPASLTTCVPPAEEPAGEDRVRLVCPRDSVPELVTFTLFADGEARQAAFVDTVASLELDPGAPGDCVLADDVVHDYVGTHGLGQLACRREGPRVDLVWTRGDVPLLATAGGPGAYSEHYAFWADLVERSDAAFPLPVEADLLTDLPSDLLADCGRDIGLTAQAGGVAALSCRPRDAEADTVSWVRFTDQAAMEAWIEGRLDALGETDLDTSDDACRPGAFDDEPGEGRGQGRAEGRDDDRDDDGDRDDEPAPPTVGFTTYEQGGTTGEILCFVNSAGQNVVFWTRDQSRIGSIAVSSTADGEMRALLEWWEKGGHRP